MDQDRGRWDQLLIRRGLTLVQRIDQLGETIGSYALRAAIAASDSPHDGARACELPPVAGHRR
jgi:predicted RNA polymerase sigma factor